MVGEDEIRAAEVAVDLPAAHDAGLIFIGRIRTPWQSRLVCPRQGRADGPICRIELFEPWTGALDGITAAQLCDALAEPGASLAVNQPILRFT